MNRNGKKKIERQPFRSGFTPFWCHSFALLAAGPPARDEKMRGHVANPALFITDELTFVQ
jgi:hypothetical protein